MKAEIISVGEELLSGDTINTNASYISKKLYDTGIKTSYHTTIGDNLDDIVEATQRGMNRSDLLVFTGGLGPTRDDLTKEGVCHSLGLELFLREDILSRIKERFNMRDLKMTDNNIKQAYMPKDGIELVNNYGTAPGLALKIGDRNILLLPGPPREMNPMLEAYISTHLNNGSESRIISRAIKTIGIGESVLETKIEDIIENHKDFTIATYAGSGQVKIKISYVSQNPDKGEELINNVINEIESRLAEYIYSFKDESLEEVVYKLLLDRKMTIGFCESCTGGLISSRFTGISGISAVFDRGIVTYSNEAKEEELKVNPDTIMKYGAVSEETALEMATGLLKREGIDIAVSVTGIAGPTGGTKGKPVGLVYIGLATKEHCDVLKCNFTGDRKTIQNRTANTTFDLVRKYLIDQK